MSIFGGAARGAITGSANEVAKGLVKGAKKVKGKVEKKLGVAVPTWPDSLRRFFEEIA